jgi:hypothetical protein
MSVRASPREQLDSSASVMPQPLVTKALANRRGLLFAHSFLAALGQETAPTGWRGLSKTCMNGGRLSRVVLVLALLAHQLRLGRARRFLLGNLLGARLRQADHQLILVGDDHAVFERRDITHTDTLL